MKKIRIFFTDIDGYLVKANIQEYVSQIELFGDEPIKDFEYIKNCIKYMLDEARINGTNKDAIHFIENVYNYVSSNMFEMLKEHRDCFLEYDNLASFEDRKRYIEAYQRQPVSNTSLKEEAFYMQYILNALYYAKGLIERAYVEAKNSGDLKLPFPTINLNNDIIKYDEDEDPIKRATSALQRMEIYAMNREKGRDDFLTACSMVSTKEIVDYNSIYQAKNIIPGAVDSLKYMLNSSMVDMIVACSHYTGYREGMAKMKLFREEFPFILMLPESLLKFHQESPCMGKRRTRSSKDKQIDLMKQKISELFGYDYDSIEVILGDDSFPNLDGLNEKEGILYRERSHEETKNGIDKPVDSRFVRQFSWNKEEIDRIFSEIHSKKENKILKK